MQCSYCSKILRCFPLRPVCRSAYWTSRGAAGRCSRPGGCASGTRAPRKSAETGSRYPADCPALQVRQTQRQRNHAGLLSSVGIIISYIYQYILVISIYFIIYSQSVFIILYIHNQYIILYNLLLLFIISILYYYNQ